MYLSFTRVISYSLVFVVRILALCAHLCWQTLSEEKQPAEEPVEQPVAVAVAVAVAKQVQAAQPVGEMVESIRLLTHCHDHKVFAFVQQ